MTTNNTPQQPQPQAQTSHAASIVKRWSVFCRRKARSVLASLQTLVHAISAQVRQQVAVRYQQKRRSLALVLMTALLILASGVLWLAKQPWYIVAILVIPASIIIGYAAKWTGFSEYTSPTHPERFQRSKTLWDWMQLLLIPVLIAAGGYWFQTKQHDTDTQIASDQQQETTLKTYLDDMSNLLLTQKLSTSKPGDDVSEVAKERTLIALRRLRGGRDKTVLQFLQEEQLVGIQNAVIDLKGADLSGDDLSGANLSGADLSGANLSGANLRGAILNGAILNNADLSKVTLNGAFLNGTRLNDATLDQADLSGAQLDNATLNDADLSGANLNNAFLNGAYLGYAALNDTQLNGTDLSSAILNYTDLSNADLSYVRNLAPSQLRTVYSCAKTTFTNTMLSTGLRCRSNPGVVTLTYWYTEAPAETPVIRQLIQLFRQKYPYIRIKAVYTSFYVAQASFMAATHVGNGNAPDVLRSDNSWVSQLASQDYLLKINSYISQNHLDLSNYLPSPLQYDWYEKGLYGLPQVTDFLALLYNKNELEQVGITPPHALETMSAFEAAAKAVRSKEGKYGFETAGGFYVLPFLWAFGGGMLDRHNKPQVNSPGSVKGLTFLLNLQNKDQVMPPKVDLSNGYNNMVNDFKIGKTAMIFDGPYEISNILTGSAFTNPDNLGIVAIPKGPSGDKPRSPTGGQSYVISAGTRHPTEAYRFISFMSSKDSQIAIADANHTLPTLQSASQDLKDSSNPIISAFSSSSIQKTAIAIPVNPQEGNLLNRFNFHIQNALDDTESPIVALNAVDTDWNTLLGS